MAPNTAQHRGARSWHFDCGCQRVIPEGWNGLGEAAPAYTAFEAVSIARGLVAIGAYQPIEWLQLAGV